MSAIRSVLMASVAILMSSAAMAQDVAVLRIGLDGGENEADQIRRSECVVDSMKAATGVSEVHLQDPNAVDPILTTKQADGSNGYHTIMVARADSGMKTLADTKGKKLGFADPDSTSGYLVPNVALPAAIGAPIAEFYSETGVGGGHENLVLGVLDGTWDVGTTFGSGAGEWSEGYTSGNLRIMVDKGVLDMDDLVELWQSPVIPNGPLMVSSKLPADMKEKVNAYFTGLPKADFACFDSFTGGGYVDFVPADQR